MNALPGFIRPGAIVRLKSGQRARIYATDGGGGFPIHGAIEMNGGWILASWQQDLSWSAGEPFGACWTIVGPDRPDYSALWPLLPPWIRFLARDEDETLCGFSERPEIYGGWSMWHGSHPSSIPAEHCPPPVGDWRESLAERPEP